MMELFHHFPEVNFQCLICMLLLLLLSCFSHVWLCATPQKAAHQAPLSLGFSRQEHWSGLPFPSPVHESEKWKWKGKVKSLSRARLFTTPWTVAYQAPPPMGFSRQEYWSGVPLPSLLICIITTNTYNPSWANYSVTSSLIGFPCLPRDWTHLDFLLGVFVLLLEFKIPFYNMLFPLYTILWKSYCVKCIYNISIT